MKQFINETKNKTIKDLASIFFHQSIALTRHILLSLVAVALLIPFYWMVASALKDNSEIFARPLIWWPSQIHWSNFIDALTYPSFPFIRFLGNSIFYASSVTIATLLSCTIVAYGFARLRFPGRDFLFAITVSTLMIPNIVTFIPTFVLFKQLGLLGSYAPLIIPNFLGNAFFIFMLRQFFVRLSWELADAARIDGAGEWRIFWEIMLPQIRPALIVVIVFTFLYSWHDFFGPLIYLSERNQYPLSLGIFVFKARRTIEWNLLMAASTITTLPLIIIFFLTQRYFLEGISFSGIKR